MADSKISALTAYTTPLSADLIPIVDTANTATKSISWSALLTALASATQTLTNKTISFANNTITTTSAQLAAALSDETGSGSAVFATSPTLVTPVLGAATATSITSPTVQAATNASVNLASGTYNTIQTYTPSAAGTATLDLSKGNIHHITMPAGNITIALSNGTAGQCFIIRILQDGTGSRTVTWFTTIRWTGGSAPLLTTTASKADSFGFEVTGTNTYDGFVVGQNF